MSVRVTYKTQEVVRIEIQGERPTDAEQRRHSRPLLRRDDGLVKRFLQWQIECGVAPACRGGMSGPGSYVGYFDPGDVPAIERWLEGEGVVRG